MTFLLDENLSPRHVQTLRSLGYDAVAAVEVDLSGAGDAAVRSFAIAQGRVLVTLDGDFANVLRYPPASTPGIRRLRLHPPTEAAIDAALRWTVSRLAGLDLRGKLAVSDGRRIRIWS